MSVPPSSVAASGHGDRRGSARWLRLQRPLEACIIIGMIIIGMILVTASLMGEWVIFEVPWSVATGWIGFLGRVGPEVEFSLDPALTALASGILLVGSLHRFLAWFATARRPDRPPWRLAVSAMIAGMIGVVFVCGIAMVGMVHQLVWLAGSPEPLVTRVGGGTMDPPAVARLGNTARSLWTRVRGDRNGDVRARTLELLADAGLDFEAYALIIPGEAEAPLTRFFLLPRDPRIRKRTGLMDCGGEVGCESRSFEELEVILGTGSPE